MNYAEIKYCDVANGPGVRTSLFVSGCTHHCKGCFNAVTWDFNYGRPFTEKEEEEILKSLEPDYIHGFTLLGGEPFEPQNQEACCKLLKKIRDRFSKKNIWAFSGYLFDRDIVGRMCKELPYTREMLGYIDVLIDGPFMLEKKNLMLKFKGSENQRTIDVQKSLERGEVVLLEGF